MMSWMPTYQQYGAQGSAGSYQGTTAPAKTMKRGKATYANSPHMVFEANPGGEMAPGQDVGVPQNYFMDNAPGVNVVGRGNPGYGSAFSYSNYMNQQGETAPAGTAPAGPAGTAGAPQAINANRLMTAPNQWGERRDPVMPLQGYQNALLRGF